MAFLESGQTGAYIFNLVKQFCVLPGFKSTVYTVGQAALGAGHLHSLFPLHLLKFYVIVFDVIVFYDCFPFCMIVFNLYFALYIC